MQRAHVRFALLSVVIWLPTCLALFPLPASAQSSAGAANQPPAEPSKPAAATQESTAASEQAATSEEKKDAAPAEAAKDDGKEHPIKDFFKPSKADAVNHRPQPPAYVKTMDKHAANYGLKGLEGLSWLEFGLEHRMRFEYRDDDYRNALTDQHQYLLRSDVYIGIRDIWDPLRFGFEFQDSRQFEAGFDDNVGDVDKYDILQGFAELYFKDAFGPEHPLSFRVGRQAFDLANRRQIARNGFRNTTNAFDGFRLTMGQKKNAWQADVIAVMPVERLLEQPDRPDEERWLYGFVYTWRGWSDVITIEVFYFVLDEDRNNPALLDREVHSLGTHVFGPIGKTGLDYDADFDWQFGNDGDFTRRAFATHGELGYSLKWAWKPRLAVLCNYATGDPDVSPRDHMAERFDPMFGDSTGYGYFQIQRLENMINPAVRLTLKPHEKVDFDAYYRGYWVAADEDRSSWAGRVDRSGKSGDRVGQALEMLLKYKVCDNASVELGYAHFFPGSFMANTGRARDSDFFFVTTTLQF